MISTLLRGSFLFVGCLLASCVDAPTPDAGASIDVEQTDRDSPVPVYQSPPIRDRERKLARNEESFVEYVQGTYPLIVVAGHGGTDSPRNWTARSGRGATTLLDLNTAQLGRGLVEAMETRYGKRPYWIVNKIHRKYADVNRPPGPQAYESAEGKTVYTTYHRAIAKAVDEAVKKWGFAFLVDVHGQSTEPADIYFGTARRKSMNDVLARYGESAITGLYSLENLFWNHKYSVPRDVPPPGPYEVPASVSGGFTVQKYGQARNVDAIQIEIHGRLRREATPRNTLISHLAESLNFFCDAHVTPLTRQ